MPLAPVAAMTSFITQYRTTGRARTLDRIGSRRVLHHRDVPAEELRICSVTTATVIVQLKAASGRCRREAGDFAFRVDHWLLENARIMPEVPRPTVTTPARMLPVPIALIMLSRCRR